MVKYTDDGTVDFGAMSLALNQASERVKLAAESLAFGDLEHSANGASAVLDEVAEFLERYAYMIGKLEPVGAATVDATES